METLLRTGGKPDVEMDTPETVVLVSIDDLRYDAIGASELDEWFAEYDALEYRRTPTFDALADEATWFEHATSTSSYTPPSHTSMLTGLYPKTHGVKTFFHSYGHRSPTLAELLSELGYETRAWVENQALTMLSVTRGFDEVVCPFEDDDADLFEFVADAADADERTFLFVHLFDVHKPYCYTPGGRERHDYNDGYLDRMDEVLPDDVRASDLTSEATDEARNTLDNYEDLSDSLREYAHNWSLDYLLRQRLEDRYGDDRYRYLVRLYLAGVERFDRGRFADLLDAIDAGFDSDRLLFVTSDHGEARCRWGDREDFMNSFNVSEQAVRVPLVVDADVGDPPDVVTNPVNHVDIVPTVADAFDVEVPDDLPGTSLLSSVSADRRLFHESWYYEGGVDFFGSVSETDGGGLSEAAVRAYPYKLVYAREETGNPDVALYDLAADPFERDDRFGELDVAADLEAALEDYLEGVDEQCASNLGAETTEDLEDRLQALGYLE